MAASKVLLLVSGLLLQANVTYAIKCYHCAGISDPSLCNTTTTCNSNEVCGVQTLLTGIGHVYDYGCLPNHCIRATAYILSLHEHNLHPSVGKRSLTGCTTCCGDALCNTGDCLQLLEKLLQLKTSGHLDVNTMRVIP